MHWLKGLKGQLRFREPLNTHTTLGIGGPADVWIEPIDTAELKKIVRHCTEEKTPYFVIGKGSNILASDKCFRGIIICLNSPSFTKIEFKNNIVLCGAGATLGKLIKQAQKRGLGGLEFLAGIPASIGGALVMNAGTRTNSIGNLIKSATVMDRKGRVKVLDKKKLKFGYRESPLNKYIVLETVLRLRKKAPQRIKEAVGAFLLKKRKIQDLTAKSAGCIFKNPQYTLTAGQMIEACGLKGVRRGGAEISARHANFMVNRNGAKAKDILFLMNLVKRRVKRKFGVLLEPEIEILQ